MDRSADAGKPVVLLFSECVLLPAGADIGAFTEALFDGIAAAVRASGGALTGGETAWIDPNDPRGAGGTFGDRLRRWRAAAGLSQEELAERVDVSPNTVARWETDRRLPRMVRLCALARELGARPADLIPHACEAPATNCAANWRIGGGDA